MTLRQTIRLIEHLKRKGYSLEEVLDALKEIANCKNRQIIGAPGNSHFLGAFLFQQIFKSFATTLLFVFLDTFITRNKVATIAIRY